MVSKACSHTGSFPPLRESPLRPQIPPTPEDGYLHFHSLEFYSVSWQASFFFKIFSIFKNFMATPAADGSSHARDCTGATVVTYTAAAAMRDPLTHSTSLGIKPTPPQGSASVGFLTHCTKAGTLSPVSH